MSRYALAQVDIPCEWVPLPKELAGQGARLEAILRSWDGTPYMRGQQRRGAGVDCVRFCAAVWDELMGVEPEPIQRLPHDAALNKPEVARAFMHSMLRRYAPCEPVTDGRAQPGDVFVTGVATSGPGHVIIVGTRPNTIWQAGRLSVAQYGWSLTERFQVLMHHYRFGDRERWLPTLSPS